MPAGLTVRELRELLAGMPETMDDFLVVVSEDPEGNGFDTAAQVDVGYYRDEHERHFFGQALVDDDTWVTAMVRATEDYTTDEDGDWVPLDEHDHPAICIWP